MLQQFKCPQNSQKLPHIYEHALNVIKSKSVKVMDRGIDYKFMDLSVSNRQQLL